MPYLDRARGSRYPRVGFANKNRLAHWLLHLWCEGATPLAKNCGQAAKPDEAVAAGRSTMGPDAVGGNPQLVVWSATTTAAMSTTPNRRRVSEGRPLVELRRLRGFFLVIQPTSVLPPPSWKASSQGQLDCGADSK